MKNRGLRDFLQEDYSTRPLKPIGLRVRNRLKPWLIRQPQRAMSALVRTRDGRRYKLLRFTKSICDRQRQIEGRMRALASHPCVPPLVWSDERNLLVEWVEGRTPIVDDPHFARRLGEAFAELYRVNYRACSRDQVLGPFLAQARELIQAGRLAEGGDERLAERLEDALPETVPTSILCGDQNLANFVLDEDGSLFMIDPGSFQSDLPIDIFLMGGILYGSIDRDAFHEGYAHAEGIDFPFLHAAPLEWLQQVRDCALQCRVLDRTSLLERKRTRILRSRIDARLARLQELLA